MELSEGMGSISIRMREYLGSYVDTAKKMSLVLSSG